MTMLSDDLESESITITVTSTNSTPSLEPIAVPAHNMTDWRQPVNLPDSPFSTTAGDSFIDDLDDYGELDAQQYANNPVEDDNHTWLEFGFQPGAGYNDRTYLTDPNYYGENFNAMLAFLESSSTLTTHENSPSQDQVTYSAQIAGYNMSPPLPNNYSSYADYEPSERSTRPNLQLGHLSPSSTATAAEGSSGAGSKTPSTSTSSPLDDDRRGRARSLWDSSREMNRHKPYPSARTRSLSISRKLDQEDPPNRSSRPRSSSAACTEGSRSSDETCTQSQYLTVPGRSSSHSERAELVSNNYLQLFTATAVDHAIAKQTLTTYSEFITSGSPWPNIPQTVTAQNEFGHCEIPTRNENADTAHNHRLTPIAELAKGVDGSAVRCTVATTAVVSAAQRRRKNPVGAFKCNMPGCQADFTTNQNLKNHLNSHNGIRAFKCVLCNQDFGTAHVLTRHRSKCAGPKGIRPRSVKK